MQSVHLFTLRIIIIIYKYRYKFSNYYQTDICTIILVFINLLI